MRRNDRPGAGLRGDIMAKDYPFTGNHSVAGGGRSMPDSTIPIVEMNHVSVTYFGTPDIVAVQDVSMTVSAGEIVGLAGESGSGKSTLGFSLLRLLPDNAAVTAGDIRFGGRDLSTLDRKELRAVRWADMSVVPQSAMYALNPVLSVGEQIGDAIFAHEECSKEKAEARGADLLRMVEVDPRHLHSYPHELSGGMRQRVLIAMALALEPRLVVMDEPTTALDVVVQAQIIQRIRKLQQDLHFAVIFITHDMTLLLSIANRILVMYAGEVVEEGASDTLFHEPRHPYTQGLISCFPSIREKKPVSGIGGSPPDMAHLPPGCRFHPRCPYAMDICSIESPHVVKFDAVHSVKCHLFPSHSAEEQK